MSYWYLREKMKLCRPILIPIFRNSELSKVNTKTPLRNILLKMQQQQLLSVVPTLSTLEEYQCLYLPEEHSALSLVITSLHHLGDGEFICRLCLHVHQTHSLPGITQCCKENVMSQRQRIYSRFCKYLRRTPSWHLQSTSSNYCYFFLIPPNGEG